jgi:hypothetical protein
MHVQCAGFCVQAAATVSYCFEKFYYIGPSSQYYKTFNGCNLLVQQSKL